jgi:DNA-directed RNA polymerase II subunit RPB2
MATDEKKTFVWDVDTWKTLDSYFSQKNILTDHQISSYNDLVDFVIPQIIERNNPITIATDYDEKMDDFRKKYKIEFLRTYLSKPLIQENNDVIKPLMPNEARMRNLTYSAPMFIDVKHTLTLKDETGAEYELPGTEMTSTELKIPFLQIPVMLHSKYCHLNGLNGSTLKELGECEYDQGAYFIVNGGEKVIVAQERVAENQVFVWQPPKNALTKYSHEAEIKSSIDQRFYPVKTCKVKLTKEPTAKTIKDGMKKGQVIGRTFHVQMPYLKKNKDIPLLVMFRALGIMTEREMYEIILGNSKNASPNYTNLLISSVEEARSLGITTQDAALNYLSKQMNVTFTKDFDKKEKHIRLKYVIDVLNRELLPHIGQNNRKKAFYLGHMTRKLMDCYFGVRPYDDRDHYGNKRVDLAGPLLCQLFRTNFIKLIKDVRRTILSDISDGKMKGLYTGLRKLIQSCNISSKIKYGLATGNWSTQQSVVSTSKKGIAQVLNRLSYIGTISHTRRVQSPLERAGSKIVAPRRLHATHFGMCCPNETPEGSQVGIVKNFSMQTHVTIQTSEYPVKMALSNLTGFKYLEESIPIELQHSTKIFINGDWYGIVNDNYTKKIYDDLRTLKRHGILVPYISISWFIDWNEIHIQTDGGRYSRPLYIVENNSLLVKQLYDTDEKFRNDHMNSKVKWTDYLSSREEQSSITLQNGALVEYMDTNEIESAMIAMTIKDLETNSSKNTYYMNYTHCEIHPMMMMSVVSTMIPFSDHNQSPRNCYQSSMGKQAIGYYTSNYNSRMDTMAHVLVYGHRPLVATRTMRYTLMDQLPHGTQAMLLYACYTGYNQEDSVVLNGDAVDRGFFNTIFFRTYSDKEQKHKSATTTSEKFTKPTKTTASSIKHGSYDAIDENGFPIVGKVVAGGDVIIGKVVESKDVDAKTGMKCKDISTIVRYNEFGTIDKIVPDESNSIHPYNAEGNPFVKVRVSILRHPKIGDKFASRHAQKGTGGMLYKTIDLPFNCYGMVPDVIMNPHGIPSRMTAGKLIETLLGKVAVSECKFQDATPFTSFNMSDFKTILKSYGLHELGNEVMYNGQTGRMFDVTFYYGPTYYQRLKHMVDDKIHSRESGPVQLLTRQPAEGRSRDGGLRLGEMERDCLIAHGVPKFLKERMMDSSDLFRTYVSKKEEAIIVGNPDIKLYKFNNQNIKDDEVMEVQLPYAMKLLLQEMESMGIDVRMSLN